MIEWLAVALGLANIALIVVRSVWNYPFGIAMVCLYAIVFHDANLYSDMILQGFFFVVQIYGWANWARASSHAPVPVRWMTQDARVKLAAVTALAWVVWSAAMARYTDAAAPWIDGGIAMMSIAAQWLLARRCIENWWLWIVVDLIAIPLFAWRGLMLTSGLYGIFLLMSVVGLVHWQKIVRGAAAPV